MAEILDFNKHRPPILPITLPDKKRTQLKLIPPTVDLQEELRAQQSQLRALLSQENDEAKDALYTLTAKLMSCNRNLQKITPQQLRTKFDMDESDLVLFFQSYAGFLTDLENAKN